MGYKRGGGPGACWGFMIWGPFGARSGPVWGPIYFGAHLGLFGAHLGPGLQKSNKNMFLLPIQAWP